MKTVYFIFKDGTTCKITLPDHVYDMWMTDKETIKAINKYGKAVEQLPDSWRRIQGEDETFEHVDLDQIGESYAMPIRTGFITD